jgi:hypothetical protein
MNKVIVSPLLSLNREAGKARKPKKPGTERVDQNAIFVGTQRIVQELGGYKLKGQRKFEWENKMRVKRGGIVC